MKKLQYSALIWLSIVVFASQAAATTIYTSYVTFLEEVDNVSVENFEDTALESGLTVTSTFPDAVIEDGVYKDRIGGSLDHTTVWGHDIGFTAWGGWFDLANPGGEGTSILITVVDTGEVIGEIDSSLAGGFWGFTTDYAFTEVRLSEGTSSGVQETYWNVDLAYATPVPEPGTMILLGLSLIGVAAVTRKSL